MTTELLDNIMRREYGAEFVKEYADVDDPRCSVRVYQSAKHGQRFQVESTPKGVVVYGFDYAIFQGPLERKAVLA